MNSKATKINSLKNTSAKDLKKLTLDNPLNSWVRINGEWVRNR